MPSAVLRFRGRVLAVETVEDDLHAQSLADEMRSSVQVEVVPGRARESVCRQTLQFRADELRDGRLFKRCPKCETAKDVNEFGLLKKVGAAGTEVVAFQAWCRSCRGGKREGTSDPPTGN